MNILSSRRSCWSLAMAMPAILILASVARADSDRHVSPGRDTPWTNCTACHGDNLDGGFAETACNSCHSDFEDPNPPAPGHHFPNRQDPFVLGACTICHGEDLTGGDIEPSCFTCHGEVWGASENSPPLVDAGGPYSVDLGQPILFDASETVDPDGDPMIYLWSLGPGTPIQFPSQSPNLTFTYEDAGTYNVLLTVTDRINDPVTVSVEVLVGVQSSNLPPDADAGGPYDAVLGDPISFDGSASSDPDGQIASYDWDFDDGSFGTGASPTHTYAAAGFYTVSLTVTDDGGLDDTVTTLVEIMPPNSPPVVHLAGPYSAEPGEPVQLDASNTFDPDGDPLIFIWDFGDGTAPQTVSQGDTITHTYAAEGSYTVELTVSDGVNDSEFDSAQVEIEAEDEDPPPPSGDEEEGTWNVWLPFLDVQFDMTIEEFAHILVIEATYDDGFETFGIGMEFDGIIFWMDVTGAIYYATIDHNLGTMSGLVFGSNGSNSIFFAEQLPASSSFLSELEQLGGTFNGLSF